MLSGLLGKDVALRNKHSRASNFAALR